MAHKFLVQKKTIENGHNDGMEPVFAEVYFVQFIASNGAVMNHFKTFNDVRDANALFINIHTAMACGKLVKFNNPSLWIEVEPVYGSRRHQEIGDEAFA